MFIEIILVLFLAICIFHYYTRYGRISKLVEKIPGLPAWPLVGSLPYLIGYTPEEVWPLFRKLNKDYYPIFKFWTTHEVVINLRHPDDVEILLSSMDNISKSTAYHLLQPWLKTGLLTSTGKKWQTRRKILTPAFHFNVLKKYIDIITDNCKKTVEYMKCDEKENFVEDLLEFTASHTLNIICETAMGVSLNEMQEFQNKYRNAVHKMGEIILYRIARPWLRNERVFGWTQVGREQAKQLKILLEFSKHIIKERKEYHEKTKGYYLNQLAAEEGHEKDDVYFGIRRKRMAMLDQLISFRNNSQIDDEGIQEEVDTFIFEGHDTTAMGLSFILLLLAEHQNVQTQARNEVNNLFKICKGKLGYNEIQQLSYLDMCIKESLRLYPSVPFISRSITQDLKLENYEIPKGAIVHVHIFDLHRDPNFWPEPDKFDPERFLPDRIQGRHPFSYIPFSAGPRNCIGQKFVMLELKATLAYILYNFILEPIDLAHEIPIKSDLVIRPARPIHIKFIPITHL